MTEPVVYRPKDLQRILGVGERRARELCRQIGVPITPARWVIPGPRLEQFLAGELEGKEQ